MMFFEVYKQKVVDIFQRISKEVAGDVPLKVINDGEVIGCDRHGTWQWPLNGGYDMWMTYTMRMRILQEYGSISVVQLFW